VTAHPWGTHLSQNQGHIVERLVSVQSCGSLQIERCHHKHVVEYPCVPQWYRILLSHVLHYFISFRTQHSDNLLRETEYPKPYRLERVETPRKWTYAFSSPSQQWCLFSICQSYFLIRKCNCRYFWATVLLWGQPWHSLRIQYPPTNRLVGPTDMSSEWKHIYLRTYITLAKPWNFYSFHWKIPFFWHTCCYDQSCTRYSVTTLRIRHKTWTNPQKKRYFYLQLLY